LRVLHLLNHTRRLNGHVHAAVDLACAQADAGHAVAMASEGGDFDALLDRHKVERAHVGHQRRPLALARSVLHLRRLVAAWRPDVVHAHMMTSAVLAWPVCRLAGIPLVTTVHNAFEKSAVLMGLGTRVIAVSAAVARSMAERGIPRRKLDVVLNGTIGSARFEQRGTERKALGHPSILFVGGLHPRKGLPDLLEAFDRLHARHPGARLHVVGDGPEREAYRAEAASRPSAGAVTFAGPQDDPYPWMLGADIFVLPSLADPAPLVLPEAREAGCAIIATAVDGIPELLEHGAAGLLVPARAPDQLFAAMDSLLNSPERLAEWRANSQIRVGFLTIQRVAEDTARVYAAALGRSGVEAAEASPVRS
jgi:glycosyltransferase involved in cell wall biosynthesis